MEDDEIERNLGEELGRRLVDEMRTPDAGTRDDSATQLLRFGADGLSDEVVWSATMTAAALASDEAERWMLADGVCDESIAARPALKRRWHDAYKSHESVRAVYRGMWADLELMGISDYGWWTEPGD